MTEQLPLFQRKNFHVAMTQGMPITPPTANMAVLSLLPAYYTYLQAHGYSPYTPADFCGDLKKFGMFVPRKPIGEITTNDVRTWVSELRKGMTNKTINRKLSALNNFFSWLVADKVLAANPASPVPNYKVTSPLPEVLYEAECTQLRTAASHDWRRCDRF
jgi:site-specific recombinase XerD